MPILSLTHYGLAAFLTAGYSQDIDMLRSRLAARDNTISSIALSFTTVSTQPPQSTRCTNVETGYWLWRSDCQAVVVLRGCENEDPVFDHTVWDGSRSRQLLSRSSWAIKSAILEWNFPEGEQAVIGPSKSLGHTSRFGGPGYLGLFFYGNPWSQYLDGFSNISALGRREIMGRSCLALLADMDNKAEDGIYTHPWRLSIDDQDTLLVVQMESFFSGDTLDAESKQRQRDAGTVLTLNDAEWFRKSVSTLEDVCRVEDRLWIGRRLRFYREDYPDIITTTTIDPEQCWVNKPIPKQVILTSFAEGVYVNDLVAGEGYFEGHRGDLRYEANRHFLESLAHASQDAAHSWKSKTDFTEPLEEADNLTVFPYAYIWLGGGSISLDMIPAKLNSPGERVVTGGVTDLVAAIEQLANDFGVPSRIAGDNLLPISSDSWCLGLYESDEFTIEPMLLQRVDHEHVNMFVPRSGISTALWEDISKRPQVRFLVPTHLPRSPPGQVSLKLWLVLLTGLVFIGTLLSWILRKQRTR